MNDQQTFEVTALVRCTDRFGKDDGEREFSRIIVSDRAETALKWATKTWLTQYHWHDVVSWTFSYTVLTTVHEDGTVTGYSNTLLWDSNDPYATATPEDAAREWDENVAKWRATAKEAWTS